MKKRLKVIGSIAFAVLFGMIIASCNELDILKSGNDEATGTITSKAYFTNSDNHAGITVTLEKTDGLRSAAAISTAQNIVSGARSIDASRSTLVNTQTSADGLYTFLNVIPGTYTIYASSPDSSEKAVAINNVTIEAGHSVTAVDLNLTAVGSIIGHILLDENTTTGNFGFFSLRCRNIIHGNDRR